VILYHFTSRESAPFILLDGFIHPEPWEFAEGDCWPDVVWLTATRQRMAHKGWLGDNQLTRSEIRFTVDIPEQDVQHWRSWARQHGMATADLDHVAIYRKPRWYVSERPIPSAQWTEVAWSCNGRSLAAR
jgi:hypothetical protein